MYTRIRSSVLVCFELGTTSGCAAALGEAAHWWWQSLDAVVLSLILSLWSESLVRQQRGHQTLCESATLSTDSTKSQSATLSTDSTKSQSATLSTDSTKSQSATLSADSTKSQSATLSTDSTKSQSATLFTDSTKSQSATLSADSTKSRACGAELESPRQWNPVFSSRNLATQAHTGCWISQQQVSVSQGWGYLGNCTCCHTEIEVADQIFYLTQSQYTDTGTTSPSAVPVSPGAWPGHWTTNF